MTARSPLAGRYAQASRRHVIRIPFIGTIEEKAVKTQLLCALALGVAASASAAAAQDTESFTVKTKVSPYCANLAASPTPLNLGSLVDSAGKLVTTFAPVTSDTAPLATGYYCNAPATVTVQAQPLVRSPSVTVVDTDNFAARVDYRATVTWGGVMGSVNSTDTSATNYAAGTARIGDLSVQVSNPSIDGTRRPIAGAYAGAVTLTVAID